MPSNLRWLVEGRVLFSYFYDEISFDVLEKGSIRLVEVVDQTETTRPIHVIYDARKQTKGVTNVAQLKRATQAVFQHPKIGWHIVITDNPIHRFIGTAALQLAGANSRLVGSYEDAVQVLNRVDFELPPMPAALPDSGPLLADFS
jgi:hypothetical protein